MTIALTKKHEKDGPCRNGNGSSDDACGRSSSVWSTSDPQGMTLTISGSGTAFKIGHPSTTQSASISLTATVEKVSFGRALLNFTGGTMTIGSDTFTVVGGHGIINFHSHKIVLHVNLKDTTGKQAHLILYGKDAHVPSPFSVGDHFNVDFAKHQSKLAHQSFLDLSATVTRNS